MYHWDLAGSTQLSTQPAEPGCTGPVKVMCHSTDRIVWECADSSGKERRLVPHPLKHTGTAIENIIHSVAVGAKSPPSGPN